MDIKNLQKLNAEMTVDAAHSSRAVDKKTVKDNFKVRMQNIQQESIRSELTELYQKIETLSDKLSDKLMISDLVEYKQLVKKFLQISVNNSHVFFKENSLDRRGRHRVYSIVRQVDTELSELTKEFINTEENRISILSRIEQIRGILLDILT